MTLNEFAQDVVDYLYKKLPDVNEATLLEIAELMTAKAFNYAQDELKASNEKWSEQFRKSNEVYFDWIKRM